MRPATAVKERPFPSRLYLLQGPPYTPLGGGRDPHHSATGSLGRRVPSMIEYCGPPFQNDPNPSEFRIIPMTFPLTEAFSQIAAVHALPRQVTTEYSRRLSSANP
jgi:hypothetical protein